MHSIIFLVIALHTMASTSSISINHLLDDPMHIIILRVMRQTVRYSIYTQAFNLMKNYKSMWVCPDIGNIEAFNKAVALLDKNDPHDRKVIDILNELS